MVQQPFSKDVLQLDAAQEVEKICGRLRDLLAHQLKRRGLVVGLSGGIDSSVTAALSVRALGAKRVLGLLMPERHSAEETLALSASVAAHLGIDAVHEDITGILEAAGCYRRYQDAVRKVIPEYDERWRSKIVISSAMENRGFALFNVVAQGPDGIERKQRLPADAYLEIVAATNFKQRTRKMLEYYHADRLHFAVTGTPNRLEYDQGFFVKLGDGAADVKPIAHLYKTQVYQLAECLGLPEEVRSRPPTTDTYSLPQGQDEFYFSLPYSLMDLCLYGKNHGVAATAVATAAGLTGTQVEHVYADIDVKRSTTRYLHLPPLLIQEVREIE
jgi:NAD+ synthase